MTEANNRRTAHHRYNFLSPWDRLTAPLDPNNRSYLSRWVYPPQEDFSSIVESDVLELSHLVAILSERRRRAACGDDGFVCDGLIKLE
jgi:hypothetical protein